ncbi:aldo/keto reductase family oxidoreductase [Spongiimicrobium sp. 3-5]|uniref:aldo/keto reductase n=1 Tax=Spongiimicrobium sp. 3-5 TaxID=3332596 RepID=UPI00397F17CE
MLNKENISPYIIGTMRLGSWGNKLSTKAYEKFIEQSLDLGLMDFDHADIYGDYTTEGDFGAVLKNRSDLRQKMRIITKCGIKMMAPQRPDHKLKSYDLSKGHILDSVENSLKNLHTDYIDLLLLHRPDYLLNPHEIAETFEKLKKEGKVKHFGVSNFTTSQFNLLNTFTPLVTNQIEVSVLHRNAFADGTLDQCLQLNTIPMAWSPLGGGSLFQKSDKSNVKAIQKTLGQLADKYNLAIDQMLYVWLRKHPSGIIPVLGTSKIERIEAACEALKTTITHEEWYMLWQAAIGKEID